MGNDHVWHAKRCIIQHFYLIFFIAIVYFYICIQSLFISIVYILFLF